MGGEHKSKKGCLINNVKIYCLIDITILSEIEAKPVHFIPMSRV